MEYIVFDMSLATRFRKINYVCVHPSPKISFKINTPTYEHSFKINIPTYEHKF